MPATWIFQANPNRFDLDGFFATKPVSMSFLVTRYAERMAVGDKVYLWRAVAGGDETASGVIAEAEVGNPVSERLDDAASRPFWNDQNEAAVVAPRVQLRVIRTAQKREVLQRRWLIEDPVLRDLTILKMANATNYEVSSEHSVSLNALWGRTGQDWTYAESLAGLWAYHSTYDGQVSRLAGSPVATIALLLGRAIPGCYNKVMNFRHIDPRDPREGMSGAGAMDRRLWLEFFDPVTSSIRDRELAGEFRRIWGETTPAAPIVIEESAATTLATEVAGYSSLSLTDLLDRFRAVSRMRSPKPDAQTTPTRTFIRDALVVAIARVRAGFSCEVPRCPHSPFEVSNGSYYAEVHHIEPLGEGGDDTPGNVACLCPFHHREAHFGKARGTLKSILLDLRSAPSRLDSLQ